MPSRSKPRDDDPRRRPRPARSTGARGKRSGRRSPGPPRGLFAEVVQAPDRDHSPGARPTICLREGESAEFREQVEERLVRRARLVRRGRDHGTVVELEPEGLVPPLQKSKELRAARAWRWHAGRPVVLPGLLADEVQRAAKRLRGALRLHERLAEPGGLAAWLRDKQADLAPAFRLGELELACADPERDLARVGFVSTVAADSGDETGRLWAKTGRLSTFEGDASLRLRIAFGEEGSDDDSDDEERHRLVADLGRRLLPGAREVAASAPLGELLARFTGHAPLLTQGIAYWNAPGGGALLHHDAFREEPGGQRGVVYTQLSGQTFWLALSTQDLGERVAEFADHLEQGAADWLRAELFPDEAQWQALLRLARDPESRTAEFASPGCGALGPLVQRGPEFTGFLVDAGHGFFLDPGDALLLPNHGTRRTALHSVFQVGERVAYGLSLAVRDAADQAAS